MVLEKVGVVKSRESYPTQLVSTGQILVDVDVFYSQLLALRILVFNQILGRRSGPHLWIGLTSKNRCKYNNT